MRFDGGEDGRLTVFAGASSSTLWACFRVHGGITAIDRIHEAGALRLRRPRGAACEGIIVNTGGGIVGGDTLSVSLAMAEHARATITSVAAEKIYRSAGPWSRIDLDIRLEAGAALDWMPQETILFEGGRLHRRLVVDVAADSRLLLAETMIFGRLASAETSISGDFRDTWRIRRDGRLVFAEESRLEGAIGAMLDCPTLGGGARAAALVLLVAPDAEGRLDVSRDALAPFAQGDKACDVEAGASARDGILVARLLAHSPERLRASMLALLTALREAPPPRIWT